METTPKKSPLERLLSLFTEVRPGEGSKVLLLTLNVFLILSAYYFIKPVREALIQEWHNGREALMKDGVTGAGRFKDGLGRHGAFDKIY